MANFDLKSALADRKTYPDTMEVVVGDGLKISLGEMRAFQEASGRDLAASLDAEKARIAEEQKKLLAGQEELVKLWTQLEAAKNATPAPAAAANDWRKDPFFAPVAEYLQSNIEATIKQQADQIKQFQNAFALGVKYIADNFSEMRYNSLPEDFRKEVGYDAAVKTAAEKKFLDSGGVPDIRKVYQEWQTPRERKAEAERISKEAYDKARQELMANQLSRPSGMPVAPAAQNDPNAPKTIRESFQRLKEDPSFQDMIYGLTTGQA